MKDMTGEICGEKFAGVHVTSANGIEWDFERATLAYSRKLRWSDGVTRQQAFLERPQLLIENGVLAGYNAILAPQGVRIVVPPPALNRIAQYCVETQLMARGLKLVIGRLIQEALYAQRTGTIEFTRGDVDAALTSLSDTETLCGTRPEAGHG